MNISNRLVIALTLSTFLLAGCVTTSYRYDNQSYATRDEAWAAAARKNAEADASISAGTKNLVDRKLLVVIPTAAAFSRTFEGIVTKSGKQYARPGTPARTQDDFNADAINANFKSIASSLKKANIYREVETMDVDSTTPNIQPSQSQDVVVFFLGVETPMPTVYFMSAKNGKQIVAVDTGASSMAERRKSVIDDVKAKALQ